MPSALTRARCFVVLDFKEYPHQGQIVSGFVEQKIVFLPRNPQEREPRVGLLAVRAR
jgi:hypothetical protein